MKYLYKYSVLFVLCMLLLTGCVFNVTKSGVSKDDPRIEFETFAKGFADIDRHNFIAQKSGYDEGVIINNEADLKKLEENLHIEFDEEVDFDEYMLFANYDVNMGFEAKVNSYDITEIAYNDTVLVVKITCENSETVEAKNGEWVCFYNISKIKKSDFPYESRDFLRFQDKEASKK